MSEKLLLETVAKAADSKHAIDITIMNMEGISLVADHFVVCHGNSDRQVQAIAKEIKDKAEESNFDVKRVEGFDEASWILMDLGDVVVHVFHAEARSFYNLEKLWGDAPREFVDGVAVE